MSVSSHLNPEPERRLWVIHEKVRLEAERADLRLGALAFFSALQMALLNHGSLAFAASLLLVSVLPVCLFAVSPFIDVKGRMKVLDGTGKPGELDSMLLARDLVKYPQMELVVLLDRYLGGGITSTPYYEDIVAQILRQSRLAARKARLFTLACVPAIAAQLLIAALIFSS